MGILACGVPGFATLISAQTDDFESGKQNWTNGPAPDPITVLGGPGGGADHYLQISATGGFGAGSKLVSYNRTQWAGDYSNLVSISMDVLNPNLVPLNVRIAMKSGILNGSPGISSNPFLIPADDLWHHITFVLSAANFTGLSGGVYATVMSNVLEFRVLDAANPSLTGDPINAILGVDNIASAVPEPGSLLLAAVGLAVLFRRK
jgi:hypothetical protein